MADAQAVVVAIAPVVVAVQAAAAVAVVSVAAVIPAKPLTKSPRQRAFFMAHPPLASRLFKRRLALRHRRGQGRLLEERTQVVHGQSGHGSARFVGGAGDVRSQHHIG